MPIMCKDVGFRYTKDYAYLLTNLQITKQQNHGQMFLLYLLISEIGNIDKIYLRDLEWKVQHLL